MMMRLVSKLGLQLICNVYSLQYDHCHPTIFLVLLTHGSQDEQLPWHHGMTNYIAHRRSFTRKLQPSPAQLGAKVAGVPWRKSYQRAIWLATRHRRRTVTKSYNYYDLQNYIIINFNAPPSVNGAQVLHFLAILPIAMLPSMLPYPPFSDLTWEKNQPRVPMQDTVNLPNNRHSYLHLRKVPTFLNYESKTRQHPMFHFFSFVIGRNSIETTSL